MSMDFLAIDEPFTTDRAPPLLTLGQSIIRGASTPVSLAMPLLTVLPVVVQVRVIRRGGAFDFDLNG